MVKKTIVITGASGGIGEAIARRLGRAGHRVVLAGRRERELTDICLDIGSNASFVVTDVTKRAQINRLRDEALRLGKVIDVWISNAGRGINRTVLELTDKDFDDIMAVNVKSALYGMQAVVPHFLERRRGHLINISSFLGRVPLASHRSAYNAAKAALNALTANLRMDLAAYRAVNVSLVMPGLVNTEFARNAIGDATRTPTTWLANSKALPPGVMQPQTADEVAAVVVGLIDNPVAEVYTNPANARLARLYCENIGAFEARLSGRRA